MSNIVQVACLFFLKRVGKATARWAIHACLIAFTASAVPCVMDHSSKLQGFFKLAAGKTPFKGWKCCHGSRQLWSSHLDHLGKDESVSQLWRLPFWFCAVHQLRAPGGCTLNRRSGHCLEWTSGTRDGTRTCKRVVDLPWNAGCRLRLCFRMRGTERCPSVFSVSALREGGGYWYQRLTTSTFGTIVLATGIGSETCQGEAWCYKLECQKMCF